MYPLVQRLRGVAWCSKQTRQFWRSSCCELLNHPHDFEGGVCSTQCSFCLLDLYVQKIHDRYLYILSTSIDIWWYLFFYTYLYNPIYIYLFVCLYVALRPHLHGVFQAEHWVLQLHGKGRLEAKTVLVGGGWSVGGWNLLLIRQLI